jgi:large subunit ribosomal protein L6e
MAPKAAPKAAAPKDKQSRLAKQLIPGVSLLGRSKTAKRRGLFFIKKKNGGKFPVHAKKTKAVVAPGRGPRFYPADDVIKPLSKNIIRKPTRLRSSLVPGTIVILLAGRFKGKRAVFLKQLPSGLLLVTGPFKLNGVPLRRVNAAYVIATATKVTLPALPLDKFVDSYFKKAEEKKATKGEADFFSQADQKKTELPAEYIANQKAVDTALIAALSKDLQAYLSTRFTLKDGDRPHLMKF